MARAIAAREPPGRRDQAGGERLEPDVNHFESERAVEFYLVGVRLAILGDGSHVYVSDGLSHAPFARATFPRLFPFAGDVPNACSLVRNTLLTGLTGRCRHFI